MDTQLLSRELKKQARSLIDSWGLGEILDQYGRVFYTGSYYLNTMVYPDLDVQILMESEPFSITSFFEIGMRLSMLDDVLSLKFDNFLTRQIDPLPIGLYWGIKTAIGSAERKWKIDLWAKDRQSCETHIKMMKCIRDAMDNDQRKLIIDIKHSLLTPEGRTPVLSGYHIYQAVLFEGLTDRNRIVAYFRTRAISKN